MKCLNFPSARYSHLKTAVLTKPFGSRTSIRNSPESVYSHDGPSAGWSPSRLHQIVLHFPIIDIEANLATPPPLPSSIPEPQRALPSDEKCAGSGEYGRNGRE